MITSQKELNELLVHLRGEQDVAIDCEFHKEGRYEPELCLVQLATRNHIVSIDPFRVDLQPLGPILANQSVRKILHAGETDLVLLNKATRHSVQSVFDTQIAAAFMGYGPSVGYMALAEQTIGIKLSKSSQFSDWQRRPLSPEQIDYALDDVRHLLNISAVLRSQAQERGRLAWITDACDEVVKQALTPPDYDRLYLKLGPFHEMSRSQLAVLRDIAKWREMRAAEINKPIGAVALDASLRQIAFELPRTWDELKQVRGVRNVGPGGRELLGVIARALALPESACPELPQRRERDSRLELISAFAMAVLRASAAQAQIATAMIANRNDLDRLVEWHLVGRPLPEPDIQILHGWRRETAGDSLLEFLDGRTALQVDLGSPEGVAIVSVNDVARELPPKSMRCGAHD